MEKLNLFEKIEEFLSIVRTSPLFLTCFIISVSILTFFLLDIKTTKKLRHKTLIFIWLVSMFYIGFNYYEYFIKLSDNLVEEIFMAIYFPNLAIYSIIIITTNFVFINKMLKKDFNNCYKTCNIIATILIDFLFILVLETILKNDIDVYETLTIYSNKTLLILLELSSGIYTSWLFMLGIFKLVFNKIGEPVAKVVENIPIIKEEISIFESNLKYNAPIINAFEKKQTVISIGEDNHSYTDVFNIKPIKTFKIDNLSNHLFIKNNDKEYLDNYSHVKKKENKFFINDLKKHLFVKPIKKEQKKPLFSFFTKNEEIKEDNYRIPLFDTLSEDPLMSMIEPTVKEEKVIIKPITVKTPVIENMTFELEEELYNKFKKGEKLNVEQYKMLKNYLIKKQG